MYIYPDFGFYATMAACGVIILRDVTNFLLSRIKIEVETLSLFNVRNQETSSCHYFCL